MKHFILFLIVLFAGFKGISIMFHMIYEAAQLLFLGVIGILAARALFSRKRGY